MRVLCFVYEPATVALHGTRFAVPGLYFPQKGTEIFYAVYRSRDLRVSVLKTISLDSSPHALHPMMYT